MSHPSLIVEVNGYSVMMMEPIRFEFANNFVAYAMSFRLSYSHCHKSDIRRSSTSRLKMYDLYFIPLYNGRT